MLSETALASGLMVQMTDACVPCKEAEEESDDIESILAEERRHLKQPCTVSPTVDMHLDAKLVVNEHVRNLSIH